MYKIVSQNEPKKSANIIQDADRRGEVVIWGRRYSAIEAAGGPPAACFPKGDMTSQLRHVRLADEGL
jgi:hypothetical protein